jgi:hypothetical protein
MLAQLHLESLLLSPLVRPFTFTSLQWLRAVNVVPLMMMIDILEAAIPYQSFHVNAVSLMMTIDILEAATPYQSFHVNVVSLMMTIDILEVATLDRRFHQEVIRVAAGLDLISMFQMVLSVLVEVTVLQVQKVGYPQILIAASMKYL